MTPQWLRDSLLFIQTQRKITDFYESIYNGQLEETIANNDLREALRKNDDYRRLNLARTVVDAPLERMKISGIISPDAKARTVLEDFWEHNQFDFEADGVHEKALEFGHSVVIALPDDEDPNLVNAYVHSPANAMVFYNPSKPRDKSYAIHIYLQYGLSEEGTSVFDTREDTPMYLIVEVYLPLTIQKWASSAPINSTIDMGTMELRLLEEVDEPIPGTIPVFHFRTARTPTGRSRLVDVAGPQLAINDTLTAMMASVRRAGYRQRYLTYERGAGADAFAEASHGSEDIESSEYVAGPDTIFTFGGNNVSLGTFDVSESSNFLAPINDLAGYLGRIADIPNHYFTNGATPPSGESYRQGDRPLAAVVEHCQKMFGATWTELFDYILSLNNLSAEAEVSWLPQVYQDKDWYETQNLKKGLGVPNTVLLVESGYDATAIAEWRADQKQDIVEDIALKAPGTVQESLQNIVEAKRNNQLPQSEDNVA